MTFLRILAFRLRSLFTKRRDERELDEEIANHLQAATEDYVRRGFSIEDARAAARRDFGGVDRTREAWREDRGFIVVDQLVQDARFAVRQLGRSPGFTAIAVAMLAFGIGANVAVFAILESTLLRPLPYGDPDRLVDIDDVYHGQPSGVGREEYRGWTREATLFDSIALAEYDAMVLPGDDVADERVEGNRVTAGFFRALGAAPLIGRTFLPGEDQPGRADVIVLSHALWQRRFGADPSVVGRSVRLGETSFIVVGVMPPSFFWAGSKDASFWRPLGYLATGRAQHQYAAVARLKPGVSVAAAQAQMDVLAARAAARYPDARGWSILVRPLSEAATGHVRRPLLLLAMAVVVVLLIAAANVASLILVRMETRSREIAMRAALGAGRRRLARQFLVESGILALAGGGAGLLVARVLLAVTPAIPRNLQPPQTCGLLDGPVPAFSLLLLVGTTLLFGVAPAWRAATTDLVPALKAEGGAHSPGRGHRFLREFTVAAMALATVLLVTAGLLVGSLLRLATRELGFHQERLLTLQVRVPSGRYAESQVSRFVEDLLARVQALPGVDAAAATNSLPTSGQYSSSGFEIEGRPTPDEWRLQSAQGCVVTPGYFGTMGIRVLRGRDVSVEDREGALPVAVISDSMARRHWPGADPVGARIRRPGAPGWRTVVGVVADTRYGGPQQQPGPTIYVPHAQAPTRAMFLAVRLTAAPAAVVPAVRRALREADETVPVTQVAMMEERVARTLFHARFMATVLGGFAFVAVGLACVGLYGVVAQSVARRRREIGVRVAVGASRARVVAMVVRQGIALAVAGVAAGLVIAVGAAHALAAMLVDMKPLDPAVFTLAPLLLVATALLATWIPARRAASIDPMQALRSE